MKDLLFGFCVMPNEMLDLNIDDSLEVHPMISENFEDWLTVQKYGWDVSQKIIENFRENKNFTIDRNRNTFISYKNNKPGGAASYVQKKDYAFMLGGAVIPEFRNMGMYRALINERFRSLRSTQTPAIFHCVSNTSAPILMKLGFKKICEIKKN